MLRIEWTDRGVKGTESEPGPAARGPGVADTHTTLSVCRSLVRKPPVGRRASPHRAVSHMCAGRCV